MLSSNSKAHLLTSYVFLNSYKKVVPVEYAICIFELLFFCTDNRWIFFPFDRSRLAISSLCAKLTGCWQGFIFTNMRVFSIFSDRKGKVIFLKKSLTSTYCTIQLLNMMSIIFYLDNMSAAVWPGVSLPASSVCRGRRGRFIFAVSFISSGPWADGVERKHDEAHAAPTVHWCIGSSELITLQCLYKAGDVKGFRGETWR